MIKISDINGSKRRNDNYMKEKIFLSLLPIVLLSMTFSNAFASIRKVTMLYVLKKY